NVAAHDLVSDCSLTFLARKMLDLAEKGRTTDRISRARREGESWRIVTSCAVRHGLLCLIKRMRLDPFCVGTGAAAGGPGFFERCAESERVQKAVHFADEGGVEDFVFGVGVDEELQLIIESAAMNERTVFRLGNGNILRKTIDHPL